MRCPLRLLPLTKRLGRRGAVLGAFGTVWLLQGVALVVEPVSDRSGIWLPLKIMPFGAWSWVWVVVGGLAVACALLRPPRDWPGFAGLFFPGSLWGLSYLMSWWPLGDNPRGWIQAAFWGVMLGVLGVVAGWPEPPRSGESEHGNAER